jgi:hypothetical protein
MIAQVIRRMAVSFHRRTAGHDVGIALKDIVRVFPCSRSEARKIGRGDQSLPAATRTALPGRVDGYGSNLAVLSPEMTKFALASHLPSWGRHG